MIRRLSVGTAAVATALALVVPAAAAPVLKVKTSIDPTSPSFADTVTARVDVVVDNSEVDPRSLRIDAPFGQWKQEGDTQTSAGSVGSRSFRTWRFRLSCLELSCLPGKEPLAVQLPPAAVTARSAAGSTLTARAVWPEFSVRPRVSPEVADKTPFEQDRALPAPTYRVNPTAFALGLNAFAGLLAVLAVGLLAAEHLRRRYARREAIDNRPPLSRALAYVRESKRRPPQDRRRAVGLLSRTLGREGNELDAAASRVAWSSDEPSPDRLEELARSVEADLEESK